jgi:hypothetical protein
MIAPATPEEKEKKRDEPSFLSFIPTTGYPLTLKEVKKEKQKKEGCLSPAVTQIATMGF